MVHIYIFDTEAQAIKGCEFIHGLLTQYLSGYNATQYFVPLQIPNAAPAHLVGKWLVKLPVKEVKQGVEHERWKVLKNRILNMPQFDQSRLYEITLNQLNTYMNRDEDV